MRREKTAFDDVISAIKRELKNDFWFFLACTLATVLVAVLYDWAFELLSIQPWGVGFSRDLISFQALLLVNLLYIALTCIINLFFVFNRTSTGFEDLLRLITLKTNQSGNTVLSFLVAILLVVLLFNIYSQALLLYLENTLAYIRLALIVVTVTLLSKIIKQESRSKHSSLVYLVFPLFCLSSLIAFSLWRSFELPLYSLVFGRIALIAESFGL